MDMGDSEKRSEKDKGQGFFRNTVAETADAVCQANGVRLPNSNYNDGRLGSPLLGGVRAPREYRSHFLGR